MKLAGALLCLPSMRHWMLRAAAEAAAAAAALSQAWQRLLRSLSMLSRESFMQRAFAVTHAQLQEAHQENSSLHKLVHAAIVAQLQHGFRPATGMALRLDMISDVLMSQIEAMESTFLAAAQACSDLPPTMEHQQAQLRLIQASALTGMAVKSRHLTVDAVSDEAAPWGRVLQDHLMLSRWDMRLMLALAEQRVQQHQHQDRQLMGLT